VSNNPVLDEALRDEICLSEGKKLTRSFVRYSTYELITMLEYVRMRLACAETPWRRMQEYLLSEEIKTRGK